jgi:glycosyltransferase involved in cell wall biosynthesis
MNATPLISIIIPIYNAEKYLSTCIESILSQGFEDFELLLINDGSKDNCLSICNDYAQRDSRIKVFDKPNGGVSSARNLGLDNATGEYVMFVDADDRLVPNALEMFSPYIPDYDFVRMNVVAHNANGTTQELKLFATEDKRRAMELSITLEIIVAPYSALFRRRLFEEHNIRFDHTLQMGEDWLVSTQLLYHAKSFIFLPEKIAYIYDRTNEASCTNNLSLAKCVQHYTALRKIEELVAEEKSTYSRAISHTKAVIARLMLTNLDRASVIEWYSAQPDIKELLSVKHILLSNYSLGKKNRLLRLLCKINKARKNRE